ncbi:MAG: Gfo/Idh/MocA family oxidoreductase [Candidatus Sumerlaeia bacterium]|nr:Gfo/Idh/MocA family oxidoreductase [Candidatus Sumerlaeia bacterium]
MNKVSRRQFIHRSGSAAAALAAVPAIIPARARGAGGSVAPANRITVGLIGRGCMGRGHLNRLLNDPDFEVLAVCDVDRTRCEEGKALVEKKYGAERPTGTYRGCAAYNDYREMLARDDLDAVVIATPDHWHAVQAMDAARAGKDIYCEKPVTLTIGEGRRLVEVVRRYDRVFQTGMQRHSNPVNQKVIEFIRKGGLGKIKAVFTHSTLLGAYLGGARFKPYRQGPLELEKLSLQMSALDIPMPAEPVPEGLDWDLWVGPAAPRPYNPCYHNNDPSTGVVPWNFCIDFGHGGLSNNAVHSFDIIQAALDVEAGGPVEILHPADSAFPTLTYRYANGTLLHILHTYQALPLYAPIAGKKQIAGMFGALFVGERGWIEAFAGTRLECQPKEVAGELGLGTPEVSEGMHNHYEDWIEAIRARRRPRCDVEYGHRAASVGHLGDIAFWVGRSLKWDPAKETFVGNEAANRYLMRTPRAPWGL